MQLHRQADPARMRAAGKAVGMMMGLVMSFFQSLAGQLSSGHFTFPGWIISLALSIAISWVIGYIVPMGKITKNVCTKLKCQPESLKARLAESLISDLLFSPLICLANILLAYRNAAAHGAKVSFPGMFLPSLGISLALGFVLAFIFLPICKKTVMSRVMKAGGKPDQR